MALLKTAVAGSGSASVGTGASANKSAAAGRYGGGPGGWHPTVLYMLGLVIAEVVIVGWLSAHLLK